MLARENMPSLSAVFTEGTRAEAKVALRKAHRQANLAAAAPAVYSSLPPAAASAAKAAMAHTSGGAPAYVMQPVLSAGDKYRLARVCGVPTPILGADAAGSASNAAAGSASVSSATAGSFQYMFLVLSMGVATAAIASEYSWADVMTYIGVQTAAADTNVAATGSVAVGGTVIATSDSSANTNSNASHASHAHRVQEHQPLWLQRTRRL